MRRQPTSSGYQPPFSRRPPLRAAMLALVILAACPWDTLAAEPQGTPSSPPDQPAIQVTIYPLLLQAPIFGATINFPDLPNFPGSGGSGSTDVSLNAAYMFGGTIEGRRWFADVNGVWADVSANHSAPRLSVESNTRFFNGIGGVRVFHDFFATGGFRRVATDLDVTLSLPSQGTTLNGQTSPGVWDPVLGVQYRGRLGRRTKFDLDFRGGGFGVGTDVDISGEATADWRLVPHVVLRAGYTILYYKLTVADVSVGPVQRTLISKQTLHGPELGIGITF